MAFLIKISKRYSCNLFPPCPAIPKRSFGGEGRDWWGREAEGLPGN